MAKDFRLKAIEKAMKKNKITQLELANRLGIKQQTVHQFLRKTLNGGNPKKETLKKYAKALGILEEDLGV